MDMLGASLEETGYVSSSAHVDLFSPLLGIQEVHHLRNMEILGLSFDET